jgi:murein DD-endopeptidase MepM/ murein hydrolase activator NlpD
MMPFDVEPVRVRRVAYDRWLSNAPPLAEVLTGLHGTNIQPLALDQAGLEALGFEAELPRHWQGEGAQDGVLYVGGYDEDRAIYDGPVFAGSGGERRTVHLGIDVFAPAGTSVFAPVAGTVHSFRDNDNPLDYGPTVILEHAVSADLTFFTLYGHLSRETMDPLAVGKPVRAGEQVASLGAPEVNGGWATHLHFQIVLDVGGYQGDYPGVCKASERAAWLVNCPDPSAILGIRPAN